MDYTTQRLKLAHRGLQLSKPVDGLDPYRLAIAKNVRAAVDGEIITRPGMALLYDVDAGATDPVHSIKRLNDDVTGRFTYFTGAGTKLYADNSTHTTAAQIDSGYSGDPLSICIHRPDQSPLPWVYFMDRTRGGRKAKSTAASDTFKSFPIGISPPLAPPAVSISAPAIKVVDDFDNAASWTQGGDAGAPALLAGKRVDTTITQILYDSGITGWACINPASLSAQLQAGMRLEINNGGGTAEKVLVESVHPAITSTTIDSIQYDSGSSGPCTIVLAIPSAALERDSMLRIATAENVRVISVTTGPQGVTSFRCSTAVTRAAGNAVDGLASFRANCANNHAAAETLKAEAVESTITFSTGRGTLSQTIALDLSFSGSRPITENDYMVINFRMDKPDKVTEIKFQLDVADTTNDFTKDFYEKAFRADDLTAAVKGTVPTLTVEQRALQREQIDTASSTDYSAALSTRLLRAGEFGDTGIDPFVPPPSPVTVPSIESPTLTQTALGDSVWSTLRWQLKDMTRAGADESRNLKNVAAIRITIICTATVIVDLDSWYVEGGFGLDVTGALYAYRYRALETKARSNLSPPTRSPVNVTRGSASIVCTTKDTTSSGDPQVTAIDVYRFDDVLEDWYLVGTVANPSNAAATTATFTDEFSDEYVKDNPLAEMDQFQPFPLLDIPRASVVNVKGTEVTWVSGDTFNTSWGRGSGPLRINGIPCTLYTSPSDSTHLSLNENLGTLSSVKLEFPEALILGQPTKAMWGPFGGGITGVFFFSIDGGSLLWTNPNNPDAASDRNRLEITSPSEPLMNGYIYDGRPYVCSTERAFEIIFNGVTEDGYAKFIARDIANTKGLFARWGLCVVEGGRVYKVARDGLYESEGGEDRAISGDLYPLFPHDGTAGAAVNGHNPPDFSQPNQMRLSSVDSMVRFKYQDTGGAQRSLLFNPHVQTATVNQLADECISEDTYTPTANVFYYSEGAGVHEELIGSSDGQLYRTGGTADASSAINGQFRTGTFDAGAGRQKKQFGDLMVDTNCGGINVTAKALIDNFTVTSTTATLASGSRLYQLVDINSGLGTLAHNIALDCAWSGSGPRFYEWMPSYIVRPDEAALRATDWFEPMEGRAAWLGGVRIDCDTGNVAKRVEVRGDGDALITTLTLTHNNRITKNYEWTPAIHHRIRLVPIDTAPWILYTDPDWSTGTEPEPELGKLYTTQPTTFDLPEFFFLRDGYVAHRSTVDFTLRVTIDGTNYDYPVAHNSGNYKKSYLVFRAIKCKAVQFTVIEPTAGVRVYLRDCAIRVGEWGRQSEMKVAMPFGEVSRVAGARQ